MKTSHLVRVMGREVPILTSSSLEHVRRVEAFVNRKLAEIESAAKNADKQVIAILAMMNIAEAYLAIEGSQEDAERSMEMRLSQLVRKLEDASM